MTAATPSGHEPVPHLKRLPWTTMPSGLSVRVFSYGSYVGQGTVDASTPDGLILWVRLDGVEGRRMFHRDDNIALEACQRYTTQ